MKLDTYNKGLAACLSSDKKVDCAYILYTTESVAPDVPYFNTVQPDNKHGVARTKSIILSDYKDNITFTLTSHNAKPLGELNPYSGVNVYGIALVVSDDHVDKDIPMYYHKLDNMIKLTENSDIAVNVNISIN